MWLFKRYWVRQVNGFNSAEGATMRKLRKSGRAAMIILNWTQIISNSILSVITGTCSAIGVYIAMKMIKHAEGGAETKKEENNVIPDGTDIGQSRK